MAPVSAPDLPAHTARSVAQDARQVPAQASLPARNAPVVPNTAAQPAADHGQGLSLGSTGPTDNRMINAGEAGTFPGSSDNTASWLGLGSLSLLAAAILGVKGLRSSRRHTHRPATDSLSNTR